MKGWMECRRLVELGTPEDTRKENEKKTPKEEISDDDDIVLQYISKRKPLNEIQSPILDR